APARISRLRDAAAVIARDDDRVAVRVDTADDADMAATAAARHDGNRANLRTGDAGSIAGKRTRHVGAGALVARTFQHQSHEGRAPQAGPARRVAAEITARFRDETRTAAEAGDAAGGGHAGSRSASAPAGADLTDSAGGDRRDGILRVTERMTVREFAEA